MVVVVVVAAVVAALGLVVLVVVFDVNADGADDTGTEWTFEELLTDSLSLTLHNILAASNSCACWCLLMSSFLVVCHSAVCSHKCLASDVICL